MQTKCCRSLRCRRTRMILTADSTAFPWNILPISAWNVFLSLRVFCLLLRWGCREHFVSRCCHSSGRDRGRDPRECWLSTLGVLHPGVPVMKYDHIRDLSPSAKTVREVCWVGSPSHIIARTMCTRLLNDTQVSLFSSLPCLINQLYPGCLL